MLNLSLILISIVSLALALFLRVYPRLKWGELLGTDHNFHYYYVDLLRKNNHVLPDKDLRIIGGSNECTYPAFYHWLLSFFPKKCDAFFDHYSGLIFDLANVFGICFLLALQTDISVYNLTLLTGIYIISPGLTFCFIGPRPFSLTPRNFSQFLFFYGCIFWLTSNGYSTISLILLGLSIVFFSLFLLTSQFGCQVFLCISGVMLFYKSFIIVYILSIIMAFILSRGFFLKQILSHVEHLKWYYKYNYEFVRHKSNWIKLINHIIHKEWRNVFYEVIFYNQFFVGLLRHTTLFIALYLIFFNKIYFEKDLFVFQNKSLWLCGFAIFAWIITSFGKGRIFGEGERYLEYIYPIQFLLFFLLINKNYIFMTGFILLIYNVIWYFYNLYQIKSQLKNKNELESIAELVDRPENILLCISNTDSYFFLRNTAVKIVGFLVNISLRGIYKNFFERFFIRYPYVNPLLLSTFCNQYKVTHIVCNKNACVNVKKFSGNDYFFKDMVTILETDTYFLFSAADSRTEPR